MAFSSLSLSLSSNLLSPIISPCLSIFCVSRNQSSPIAIHEMSWLRSAVNRAVEVGGQNSVSRAVRTYAGTVVNQAVVGGSRLFQENNGARNFQSFKLAAKRLEEVSVSCRGVERVQLLRRWLVALKQIERLHEAVNPDHLATVAMYYDPDLGGEPMDFRDVFLHSQALEGITLSLVLDEPNQEEISLLQGIFRICLMGGKEALDVTVSGVQDLAKAFSSYNEEVLAKKAEMLQLVQDVMAGLKVKAEIVRIDSEVSNIHKRLDGVKNRPVSECKISSEKPYEMQMEYLNEALAHVRNCSRLVDLLSCKKLLMQNKDCLPEHEKKVEKLKVLSESLAGSASKAEKRILDNRMQREEALKFRITRSDEVNQAEKDLIDEIKALQKRKDELEEELKQVASALTSAQSRLHNAKEERDHFEEASNQIISHFSARDDEISKCIASYRAEAKLCNTFINFLESARVFKSSCAIRKEKLVNDELAKHGEDFVNWATSILEALKDNLEPSLSSVRELVEKLKRLDEATSTEVKYDAFDSRKQLEKQYQTVKSKMKIAFSLVESIKAQFPNKHNNDSRTSDGKMKELLNTLDKIRHELESIESPTLALDTPPKARIPALPFLSRQVSKVGGNIGSAYSNVSQRRMSLPFNPITAFPMVRSLSTKAPAMREVERLDSFGTNRRKSSDAEAQLSKLKWELELEDHNTDIIANPVEGIIEWEFDEKFEKEPRNSI